MEHTWVYRAKQGPNDDGKFGHYWICSRCDSWASNFIDDLPPRSTGMVLARDKKTLLTCEQKMIENIQVG